VLLKKQNWCTAWHRVIIPILRDINMFATIFTFFNGFGDSPSQVRVGGLRRFAAIAADQQEVDLFSKCD
jgi:hypothetical protein